jgi:hypothetical protein
MKTKFGLSAAAAPLAKLLEEISEKTATIKQKQIRIGVYTAGSTGRLHHRTREWQIEATLGPCGVRGHQRSDCAGTGIAPSLTAAKIATNRSKPAGYIDLASKIESGEAAKAT